MKLQQLRYIWEVAHHDLNVSATAQSLQLKALEVSVGARTSTAISEIPGTVWVVDQVRLTENPA